MLQVSTCQSFETDCKDLISMTKDLEAWPSFSTELEEFMKLKAKFTEFSIVFVLRQENVSLLGKLGCIHYCIVIREIRLYNHTIMHN